MGEEFKDLETSVPTLTLEPEIDQPAEVKAAMAQAAQQAAPAAETATITTTSWATFWSLPSVP